MFIALNHINIALLTERHVSLVTGCYKHTAPPEQAHVGLSVALCLAVGCGLDDEDRGSRNQQHWRPATRCEELQDNPEKYQARANQPQHGDQGISLSL